MTVRAAVVVAACEVAVLVNGSLDVTAGNADRPVIDDTADDVVVENAFAELLVDVVDVVADDDNGVVVDDSADDKVGNEVVADNVVVEDGDWAAVFSIVVVRAGVTGDIVGSVLENQYHINSIS